MISLEEKGDHPDLDNTELLDPSGGQKFQSLIGYIQWSVSIGILDVATADMSLSGYCLIPRAGHMERAKRVIGYLAKMKHVVIRFRTGLSDYSDIPHMKYDWEHSVCGNVNEELPRDSPEEFVKTIILSHYIDANLYYNILTGRSVTGILYFINQTPIGSKK